MIAARQRTGLPRYRDRAASTDQPVHHPVSRRVDDGPVTIHEFWRSPVGETPGADRGDRRRTPTASSGSTSSSTGSTSASRYTTFLLFAEQVRLRRATPRTTSTSIAVLEDDGPRRPVPQAGDGVRPDAAWRGRGPYQSVDGPRRHPDPPGAHRTGPPARRRAGAPRPPEATSTSPAGPTSTPRSGRSSTSTTRTATSSPTSRTSSSRSHRRRH